MKSKALLSSTMRGVELTAIGRYTLGAELGRGAMGVVHRGVDPSLDRPVAVKLLEPASGPISDEQRERFRREARVAASLRHPNIVTVYELIEDAGRLAIVMELVDGMPLDHLLQQQGRLQEALALSLTQQLLSGLAAAQQAGLVHRDIKPANLLVDTSWRLKIVDFGIAKMVNETLTAHGVMFGTLGYVAPEMFRGQSADHRSDLFAVGCLIYEMIAGVPAFHGDNLAAVSHATLFTEPAFDRELWHGAPALHSLALRLLRKDPLERVSSAHEALALLAEPMVTGLYPVTESVAVSQLNAAERVPVDDSSGNQTLVVRPSTASPEQTSPDPIDTSVSKVPAQPSLRTPLLAAGLLTSLLVLAGVGWGFVRPSRTVGSESGAQQSTLEALARPDGATFTPATDALVFDTTSPTLALEPPLPEQATSSSSSTRNSAKANGGGAGAARDEGAFEALSVDADSLSLFVGDERLLRVSGAVAEAISWQSDFDAVATVASGLVKAINPGRAEILIDAGEATLRVPVLVRRGVETPTPPSWEELDAKVANAVMRRDRRALEQALSAGGSAGASMPRGEASVLVAAARSGDVNLVNLLLRCGAPSRGPVVDSAVDLVSDQESALFKALDAARNGEGIGIQDCGERVRTRRSRPTGPP